MIAIALGVVAFVALVVGSWLLVSGEKASVAKSDGISRENAVVPADSGNAGVSGNVLSAEAQASSSVSKEQAAVSVVPEVRTKAEANRAIADLDELIASAGDPTR